MWLSSGQGENSLNKQEDLAKVRRFVGSSSITAIE